MKGEGRVKERVRGYGQVEAAAPVAALLEQVSVSSSGW